MQPSGAKQAAAPTQPATPPALQPPNAPGAPGLTQATGSDLTVTWAAPATDTTHGAATLFNLQSSPSGIGQWTVVSGVSSPYDLSGLTAGAAFDVQVRGANAAGAGAWSPTSTAITAIGVPNAPAAPMLSQSAGSSLSVIWLAPATDSAHGAATSYNLRSAPSGSGNWTTATGVASPYTLTGLTAAAGYDVQAQAVNASGAGAWSATATLTTAAAGAYPPNAPLATSVAAPPDGTTGKLSVSWTAPATDATHGAATGYNLRYSPSGAGTWTVMSGVSSPAKLTGLTAGAAFDVEVQATNAAASASAWTTLTTASTWGSTVTAGVWQPASTQVHGTSMAPNGGVQMVAAAAPTTVTGAAFAWSTSATTQPTSGLVAAGVNQQATNGWGAYMNAPASAGTYYLWMMAQGAGSATIGALVTGAITVT